MLLNFYYYDLFHIYFRFYFSLSIFIIIYFFLKTPKVSLGALNIPLNSQTTMNETYDKLTASNSNSDPDPNTNSINNENEDNKTV